MSTRPEVIHNALMATGAVTEQRISRRLAGVTCPRCHALVVRGLDADILAFDVTCDPQPTTELGEALAVATGRRTYDLTRTRTGLEIEPRRAHHIAQPRRHPVLAEHRCGTPLPAAANPEVAGDPSDVPF